MMPLLLSRMVSRWLVESSMIKIWRPAEILLIPDVAVGSDEHLEAALLWRRQQVAVGQPVPAHMVGSFDLMT